MEIRIAGVVEESFVDGPGIRFAVFVRVVRTTARTATIPKHTISAAGALSIQTVFLNNVPKIPL